MSCWGLWAVPASAAADSLHLSSNCNLNTLQDFKMVAKMPALVALGAALQYTIMPLMVKAQMHMS